MKVVRITRCAVLQFPRLGDGVGQLRISVAGEAPQGCGFAVLFSHFAFEFSSLGQGATRIEFDLLRARIQCAVAAMSTVERHQAFHPEPRRLPPHTEIGEIAEEAKDVQKPQNHGDNHDPIQDAFNGPLHRYVAVNQPKKNPNHDQDYHELNQRHDRPPLYCVRSRPEGLLPSDICLRPGCCWELAACFLYLGVELRVGSVRFTCVIKFADPSQ